LVIYIKYMGVENELYLLKINLIISMCGRIIHFNINTCDCKMFLFHDTPRTPHLIVLNIELYVPYPSIFQ
jgi:hypothetical protein